MIRGWVGAVACMVLLATSLSACDAQRVTPSAKSASATASATSRDVLTAKAKSVYENYLSAVQAISERDNTGFEALKPYATPAAYSADVKSFESQRAKGIHTTGPTRLVKFQAQSVDVSSGRVVAYACVDLSKVKVVASDGRDVTPASRPALQTSLPSFETVDGRLLLDVNGSWAGDSIC